MNFLRINGSLNEYIVLILEQSLSEPVSEKSGFQEREEIWKKKQFTFEITAKEFLLGVILRMFIKISGISTWLKCKIFIFPSVCGV